MQPLFSNFHNSFLRSHSLVSGAAVAAAATGTLTRLHPGNPCVDPRRIQEAAAAAFYGAFDRGGGGGDRYPSAFLPAPRKADRPTELVRKCPWTPTSLSPGVDEREAGDRRSCSPLLSTSNSDVGSDHKDNEQHITSVNSSPTEG